MSSEVVSIAFASDNLLDYSEWVRKLIHVQSPVLVYVGEFDAQDGPAGQDYWINQFTFDNNEDFQAQARKVYWVDDPLVTTDDGQIVGGYWRNSTYFTYLTVPKAGHFVPANYYRTSFQFFSDYINQ